MVRVKLSKGLSYSGIITATQRKPLVDVSEKILEEVLATGYFTVVKKNIPDSKTPEELAAEKLAAEKADLTKRAEKLELQFPDDDPTIEQLREAVEQAEAKAAEEKELGAKSRGDVDAVATSLGIDFSNAKNKDEVIALIIASKFPAKSESGAQQ